MGKHRDKRGNPWKDRGAWYLCFTYGGGDGTIGKAKLIHRGRMLCCAFSMEVASYGSS